jgi:hypothetical protein
MAVLSPHYLVKRTLWRGNHIAFSLSHAHIRTRTNTLQASRRGGGDADRIHSLLANALYKLYKSITQRNSFIKNVYMFFLFFEERNKVISSFSVAWRRNTSHTGHVATAPNILMNTLFSNILTVCSSRNVRDRVRIHEMARIVVLCILIFRLLDNKPERNRLWAGWQQAFPEF